MSKTVQYIIISTTKMHSAGPTCTGYTHSRPLGGVVRNKVTSCKQMPHCWELQCIVERIQPIRLALSKETMGNAPAWPQQCCATLRRPRNKRNVGSCWLKV